MVYDEVLDHICNNIQRCCEQVVTPFEEWIDNKKYPITIQ